jgi:hypothetical protein
MISFKKFCLSLIYIINTIYDVYLILTLHSFALLKRITYILSDLLFLILSKILI